MKLKHFFNFTRVNIHSSAYNQILLPIDDLDETLIIHGCHVSSVEPSFAQHPSGFLRLLPVSLHDLGSPQSEFAHLIERERAATVRVDDAGVGFGYRNSDRAGLSVSVRRIDQRHRRGLGEAVPFDQLSSRHFFEAILNVFGQSGASADAQSDAGKIAPAQLRITAQRVVHGRNSAENAGTRLLNLLGHVGQFESRQQDHRAATQDRQVHSCRQSV